MPPQTDTAERSLPRDIERVASHARGPNALTVHRPDMGWLEIPRDQLRNTLSSSLYPGAKPASVDMVLDYCEAAGLNVMLKPVHIVPMNVKKPGGGPRDYEWRDVVMPGINHYRTQASRTGTYVGKSEPEFGPMVERKWGAVSLLVPEWCKVTVWRLVGSHKAEFTAVEYWDENYATKGRDDKAPNAMWFKRPRGQLAKVAEAQALRMGFPELAGAETAEEMEGKVIDLEAVAETAPRAATRRLDQFAGEPAGAAGEGVRDSAGDPEPEDAEVEDVREPGPIPVMPEAALKAWTDKQDWKPGWKWLNEVVPTLDQEGKQELADTHHMLLWAVYDSDVAKKGPQSKAAQKFSTDHKITIKPKVAGDNGGTDNGGK